MQTIAACEVARDLAAARNSLQIQSMGEEGFEPSKAKPTDLQSVLVDHLSTRPRHSEHSSLVARIALRNARATMLHARDDAQFTATCDAE